MKLVVPLGVALLGLVGCSQAAAPGVLAGEPWVRTTDGKQKPEMTAVFVNLTNPTSKEVKLTAADCGDVAQKTELHIMEKKDGQMMMTQTEAIAVPAEGHEHLAPGGPHIMLMGLNRQLPVGSEEVKCQLTFDNGQKLDIVAPVKEFTEEQETYHTHEGEGHSG
ncbi:copper chaperone PCu(A)C [Tessaracoccus sp. OH4464_COT-324]|uniref:copper chaperone PCu(A)C n=1 Tax=Tessaracoccus sp. OH4464_COT-324 TaxID=2491059 RepID=UPI001F17D712|nr:copper chaperone PCu(A)C [Tessaracoccus sp. OH4464_COT-324]